MPSANKNRIMKHPAFKVTYIGGPTAIIEIAGLRFMTDPTLDPLGSVHHAEINYEKTIGPVLSNMGKIDIVLLSHEQHFDNLDSAGRSFLSQVSKTYTTVSSAKILKGTSIGLASWESDTVKTADGTEITITAMPARHGPAGIEKIAGEVTGFLLTVQNSTGLQIYITGDTVYYEGIAEVSKRYNPQYVFIFAGAANPIGPFNVTMDTNDAIDTAMAFPTATIIPLHYEGWKHFTEDENDLKYSYEVLGMAHRLKILKPGVTNEFNV